MLGLANISEVSSEMNETVTNRPRRCRCCGQTGHDRRTCPDPSEVERRRQRRNAIAEQLRQQRLQHRQQTQQQSNTTGGGARQRIPARQITGRNRYKIINNNNYHMYIYCSNIVENVINYTHCIGESSTTSIKAYPMHRFVFIPVPEIQSIASVKSIDLRNNKKAIINFE